MAKPADKEDEAVFPCSCKICLLHPHLKGALRRMQPPELRLYSHAELLQLLVLDISCATDSSEQFRVGSDESWWHLCAADPTFPFYFIPTREFVASLASYLACRVRALRDKQQKKGSSCCWNANPAAACSRPNSISCCSTWDFPRPVLILECGAGTGLLAAHLVPLLQQLLHPGTQPQDTGRSHLQEQQNQKQQLADQPKQQHGSDGEAFSGEDSQQQGLGSRVGRSCTRPSGATVRLKGGPSSDRSGWAETQDSFMFTYVASELRQSLHWCPRRFTRTLVGCRSVMQQLCPQLVICCWMPFNVDWTQAARDSCCACCRHNLHKGEKGNNALQRCECVCRVQEYILIGHAEGGLVGRPLETWGLHCPHGAMLPLGVDYEDPQELLQCCSSLIVSPNKGTPSSAVAAGATREAGEQGADGRKRRRSNNNSEVPAAAQWRPANGFCSIPPEVRAVEPADHTADTGVSGEKSAADEWEAAGEFGGMQLMPLADRPYYQDGFVRLPPVPSQSEEGEETQEKTEGDSQLRELQNLQQLSRFDSLNSLRRGLPSVSQIVVFRRTSN